MSAHTVGKLHLEGLMSRAEILFTAGYVFEGPLDVEKLKESYESVVDAIGKLQHQLEFRAQDDFAWKPFSDYDQRFHVVETEDIEEELKSISERGFDIRSASKNFPMNLVVIKSKHPASNNRFAIAQMCSHEFIDARSAETLFHLIVDHYNALHKDDQPAMKEVIATAERLHTLDATEMSKLLRSENYDFEANLKGLENYVIEDVGDYGVRIGTLPELLPEFSKRSRRPVSCLVNAAPMIDKCRSKYPEVTKNAIITGVLHKALYNINVEKKGKPEGHLISGKTVSDLLSPQMRESYIGNYIAFVPISTRGEGDIEDIAKAVHDRIVEFKTKQINLTCFEGVEAAAQENLVGTADDELSYVITNWNNYRFLSGEELLHGCKSVSHLSAVNVAPLDEGGAALINRAIVVINLSLDDKLCFSMFPSLRDDEENRLLVSEVEKLFNNA